MTRKGRLLLAPVGAVACCGTSTLAATAAGATFLGITVEAWALGMVGALIIPVVALRATGRVGG